MPDIPGRGLIKGLGVTLRTMLKPAVTTQYPHEKETPAVRARGVIALKEENCTVCMLCARSCPDWCIYIEGHKEKAPPRRAGGRPRQVNALDRFDIDYALCMYCGICVEVCPFDALHWSPEFEYSELDIRDLLHEKDRLGQWMPTVPVPPALDPGAAEPAEVAAASRPARPARTPRAATTARPATTTPPPAGPTGSVPPAAAPPVPPAPEQAGPDA
jgi:NADH-quinone oxidoreductase subunit I